MTPLKPPSWLGRTCIDLFRFRHQCDRDLLPIRGALEISWDDGSVTSFDIGSHWNLQISNGPWVDPYESLTPEQLASIVAEDGIWERFTLSTDDELGALRGRVATAVTPKINQVGEIDGLNLIFSGGLLLEIRAWGGDLIASVRTAEIA